MASEAVAAVRLQCDNPADEEYPQAFFSSLLAAEEAGWVVVSAAEVYCGSICYDQSNLERELVGIYAALWEALGLLKTHGMTPVADRLGSPEDGTLVLEMWTQRRYKVTVEREA